jgi:hypothetical protein
VHVTHKIADGAEDTRSRNRKTPADYRRGLSLDGFSFAVERLRWVRVRVSLTTGNFPGAPVFPSAPHPTHSSPCEQKGFSFICASNAAWDLAEAAFCNDNCFANDIFVGL